MLVKWLVSLMFIPAVSFAAAKNQVEEIPSPIDRIFAPVGFDDNDAAEVIVHGDFSDDCHKVARTDFKVDEATKTIKIWATAYRYKNVPCRPMRLPFIQVIKLGMLKSGAYSVVWQARPELQSVLTIRPKTSEAPDDFLYAPVSNGSLRWNEDRSQQVLALEGQFPFLFTGCMKIKEVRSIYYETGELVVLPIAEIFPDSACSEDYRHDFREEIVMKQPVASEALVHIRVLESASLNVLFSPIQ